MNQLPLWEEVLIQFAVSDESKGKIDGALRQMWDSHLRKTGWEPVTEAEIYWFLEDFNRYWTATLRGWAVKAPGSPLEATETASQDSHG